MLGNRKKMPSELSAERCITGRTCEKDNVLKANLCLCALVLRTHTHIDMWKPKTAKTEIIVPRYVMMQRERKGEVQDKKCRK